MSEKRKEAYEQDIVGDGIHSISAFGGCSR